mgnify:CR=1 FL=1
MAEVRIEHVFKRFGAVTAVNDFDLVVKDGEFVSILGPSGCGKTTTLRMIAGFERATEGEIYIGDHCVSSSIKGSFAPPEKRDIGMVFQSYAVWPHMTVAENVGYPLKIQKVDKKEREERVQKMLELVHLGEYSKRYPHQLSGGQQQRVALARALVAQPGLLLLDEPLSNLDAKLRVQMRIEIAKLHQRLGTTIIYVTHDQTEAMTLGTRIVVMKDGVIQQVDTPQNLYEKPCNLFVAGFMGSPQMNFLDATVKVEGDIANLVIAGHSIPLPPAKSKKLIDGGYDGKVVTFGIRPEDVYDSEMYIETSPQSVFTSTIKVYELLGAEVYLYFDLDEFPMTARVDSRTTARPGDTVKFALDVEKIHVFDKETEQVITN